jgi:hypothetical protein
MDLNSALSIVASAAGVAAATWKIMQTFRDLVAERLYVSKLRLEIKKLVLETKKMDLETQQKSKETDQLMRVVADMSARDENSVKTLLAGKNRAQTDKLLEELQSIANDLPEQQRKSVLDALDQPSEKGRVAYAAKILSQLEPEPDTTTE